MRNFYLSFNKNLSNRYKITKKKYLVVIIIYNKFACSLTTKLPYIKLNSLNRPPSPLKSTA